MKCTLASPCSHNIGWNRRTIAFLCADVMILWHAKGIILWQKFFQCSGWNSLYSSQLEPSICFACGSSRCYFFSQWEVLMLSQVDCLRGYSEENTEFSIALFIPGWGQTLESHKLVSHWPLNDINLDRYIFVRCRSCFLNHQMSCHFPSAWLWMQEKLTDDRADACGAPGTEVLHVCHVSLYEPIQWIPCLRHEGWKKPCNLFFLFGSASAALWNSHSLYFPTSVHLSPNSFLI